MGDYIMWDAAYLPETKINEPDVWAGYISGAAEHIWPDTDWQRISHKSKLPISVARTNKTGTYCGLEAIMAIYKLGIPRGTAIAMDIELFFNNIQWTDETIKTASEFLIDFAKVLDYFGYLTWKYGSTSYLFRLPEVDGSWVATDSKVAEQYPHSGVHATQYDFEQNIDISVIHRFAVHHRLTERWGING